MSILLIAITALATVHFVYEAIIAPGLRIRMRNKLFEARDELRALKVEGIKKNDEEAFWYVHNGINGLLNRLPSITISSRIEATHCYQKDAAFKERIAQRVKMLEDCQDERVRKIFNRATDVVEEVFIINMAAWLIYIVPIALLLASLGKLKRLASELVVLPERDSNRLLTQA